MTRAPDTLNFINDNILRGKLEVLIEKGSAAVSCDANRPRYYIEQLNMNFSKVNNLDLLEL